MKVKIESVDVDEIKAFVEDIPGIEVGINVFAYFIPEEEDPLIGYCPADVDVESTTVYIGEIHGIDKYIEVDLGYRNKQAIEQAILKVHEDNNERGAEPCIHC